MEQKNNSCESHRETRYVPMNNERVDVTNNTFTNENLLLGSKPYNHPWFVIGYIKE